MNKIVSKFLSIGEKFMPEMHLRPTWFTYSACGPFTENKEIMQILKKNRRFSIYLSKQTR